VTTEAAVAERPVSISGYLRHWPIIGQLALIVLIAQLYQLEGTPFTNMLWLAAGGFLVSIALPIPYRLPWFTCLSIAAVFVVFGLADGAWLIALGLTLIGICHIPIDMRLRIALLLLVGLGLAVLRMHAVDSPWSAAIWPILGAMFMFRLILYVRSMKSEQGERTWWSSLAYFFMLPNVAFPLYPVVDYQTFRRTHFDIDETKIYEQGILWISRGFVHLVLYRFVYHNLLNDPADVARLSDVVQIMLGTFLLYLKVSGQFHVIVGLLHLFGFRLPETHKLYYLAHSFTELWRRINIYWTDFMMKTVFYPTYFRVKRFGPAMAVGLSTTAVFVTTWLLHSYQWFWLRGGFPMTWPDALFWGILGALVVRGALKELRATKAPKRKAGGWDFKLGLRAATTFFAFCLLWSLWSTESITQWIWMLANAGTVDIKGIVMLLAIFGSVALLGGFDWEASKRGAPSRWRQPWVRSMASLVFLLLISLPALRDIGPRSFDNVMASLHNTGLNVADAARHHRGYYEQLDVRGQLNAALAQDKAQWLNPSQAGIIRNRDDRIEHDLYPSLKVDWNGKTFTTNSFGMRDQEYSVQKPAGTYRIALLGPSHIMGNGVGDAETFEHLVEERLNHRPAGTATQKVEILNFAVDGFTLPQQLAMLEDRVLQFQPDMVIVNHYHRGRVMTERYLAKITWKGVAVDDDLRAILAGAGIDRIDHGTVAIPTELGRAVGRTLGMDPRMPQGEFDARVRRISDEVNEWALQRIATVVRDNGAVPVLLALNAVIDDAPSEVPNIEAVRRAHFQVFNLFNVFPIQDRAALRVAPWDDHPNSRGHQLIADAFYAQLIGALPPTSLQSSVQE
jgi:D-alanyl-lipoteichoic acid acyltransferase DltB (MBOAT superfamily)